MSELDKTIEELEAEVSAELEEAKKPTDGAGKSDSMEKADGEVEDLGKAVVDPESKDSAGKKASAKVKKAAEPKASATKEDTELDHEGDQDAAPLLHVGAGRGRARHVHHHHRCHGHRLLQGREDRAVAVHSHLPHRHPGD